MAALEPALRIALLIDADNAPANKIDEILSELSTLGVINVRRAYGNWTKSGLDGWQHKLLEYAIRPVQQFDYSKHKNATDMMMTVDAMELFYADRPDAFGIVSSDADFTPLVMHLRSKGAAVYGFGAEQTPKPFVNACSRFLYLEAIGMSLPPNLIELDSDGGKPGNDSDNARSARMRAQRRRALRRFQTTLPLLAFRCIRPVCGCRAAELRQDARLMQLLRDAVQGAADEDGWAKVGGVGHQIANKTSFDSRNYGYASLSKLLAATQAFDLRAEGSPQVAVRDKRSVRTSTSV